jgi:hypothetical protein
MKKLLTLLMVLMAHTITAQVAPVLYYDFDQTNPLAPRVGTGNLNSSGGNYQIAAGAVGNSIYQLYKDSLFYTQLTGGAVSPVNGYSVQMLIKPGYWFLSNRGGYLFQHGFFNAQIKNPSAANTRFTMTFSARVGTSTSNTTLTYELDGINKKSMQWLLDSAWHHMAFTAGNGALKIYIDGDVVASGTLPAGSFSLAGNQSFIINEDAALDQYYGGYDEVAVYTQVLTDRQIYKNYLDFKAGDHYTTALASSIPTPLPQTGPLDVTDFPVGYTLGSTSSINCTYSSLNQLLRYSNPRYPFSHSLRRNFNWANPQYMGGFAPTNTPQTQPDISDPQMQSRGIQEVLYKKYNYMLIVSANISATTTSNYTDTNSYAGKWVALANQNPTWERSGITFWITTFPNKATAPYQYVMRTITGNPGTDESKYITTGGSNPSRIISVASPQGGLINTSGQTNKSRLTSLLSALSPSRVDFVNENAEVWFLCDSNRLSLDPTIVAEKTSLGLNYRDYFAYKQAVFSKAYRDTFMQLQPSALYSQYNISGWDGTLGRNYYYAKWSYMKSINRQIGGRYYSTMDFYPRYPSNWRYWSGAWHGQAPYDESRQVEVAQGDKIFSPFVSAGWNSNEESNQRPGRYLGELKCLGAYGTDFYYAGFFNEAAPWPHPKGYTYQLAQVSYAQAILARYDTIVKTGNYIRNVLAQPTTPDTGYATWAGDPRVWCVVRQDTLYSNHYVITASIQPSSNMKDQVPDTWAGAAKVGGQNIRFEVRPQGSVYHFVSDSAKLVYMDSWHERQHPDRWTDDITLEAEVADSSSKGRYFRMYGVKTYPVSPNNYYGATSVLTAFDTTERYYYGVYSKVTTDYKTYVRARVTSAVAGKQLKYVYQHSAGTDSVTWNIDADTAWKWYYVPDSVTYTRNVAYRSQLLVMNSGVEVDRVVITYKDTTLLPKGAAGCTPPAIGVNYTSPFCDSTLVTLTGANLVSYSWSTGATTSSIYVKTTGQYAVTVTNNLNCKNDTTFSVVKINCDTLCPPPSNPQVLEIFRYSVKCRITPSTQNAYAYQASVINVATGAETLIPMNVSQTTFRVTGLRPNTSYAIKFRTYCLINGVYSYSSWTSPLYVQTNP